MQHLKSRLSRRGLLSTAALLGAGALAGACGGAAAPTAAPKPTEAPKPAEAQKPAAEATKPAAPPAVAPAGQGAPVTLRFNNRTGKELEVFTEMAKTFQEKNPNITIKHESFAGANQEYFQKMAVLIAGGTEADLVWMSSIEGFYDYASRNVWLPVDDRVARDKVDLNQWYKTAVEMMSLEGKMYGLPLWSHPSVVGLFYNQDLLDQAKVKPPDDGLSFDQLSEIAKQLTKRTTDGKAEVFGYNPSRGYYNGHGQVILAFGGEMISKDGKKMTYDQPAVKEGLQWMADLHHKDKVVPLPGEADAGQLTVNGKLATWANGVWGYWSASQWKFNWGATLTPKGKSGTHGSMLQTDSNPISKRSKNVDPAWEFHKFTCSQEAGMVLLDQNYVAGSRPDIYNHPKAKASKGLAPFAAALAEAVPLPKPANYRLRELEIAINQVMDNLWLGKMTVDEVTKEVNRVGQQILDKPAGAA